MSTREAGNSDTPASTSGTAALAELDARVTAMLDEATPGMNRPEIAADGGTQVSGDGVPAGDADASQGLEQRVEAALAQAQQALNEMTALSEPHPELGAPSAGHDGSPAASGQGRSVAAEVVPADIRTLDQQLSSTAEKAVEDEFSDAASILGTIGASEPPAPIQAPPTPSSSPPPAAASTLGAGAVDARTEPVPAPGSTPVAAPPMPERASPSATTPSSTAPSSGAAKEAAPRPVTPPRPQPGERGGSAPMSQDPQAPARSSALAAPRKAVVAVATMVMTPLMRSVEPLAARLATLSPGTRQTVAWLALLTAFNAGVTWVYVLTRGSPDTAATAGHQPSIVGAPVAGERPAPPGEGGGSASADRRGSHGSP
jgi:hypothetical protein